MDDAVEKTSGQTVYLWSAVEVDTGEIIAVYVLGGIQRDSTTT
ncbi:MAG: hypothetical protein QXH32_02240 [Candidatus Caldarchaeum sp.]